VYRFALNNAGELISRWTTKSYF